jgi:hypothetical protein
VEDREWNDCFLNRFVMCKWCVPFEKDAIKAIYFEQDFDDWGREEVVFGSVQS